MADQSQKTKQSTDEQLTSTSRRSVLSSLGAGVAALGVGVGSIDTAKASSGPFPQDHNEWDIIGWGDEGSLSEATTYGVELSYEEQFASWLQCSTTATGTREVNLEWTYDGNHAYYGADAGARISVNNDHTYLVGPYKDVSGSFRESGELTLSLSEGDTITAAIRGNGGSYWDFYHGSLELIPLHNHPSHGSSRLTSAPIEALDANEIRYYNIGGPFSVQLGEFSSASKTAYLTVDADGTEILAQTVSSGERVHGEAYPPKDVFNGTNITLTTYRSESQDVQLDQQRHTVEWGSYVEF